MAQAAPHIPTYSLKDGHSDALSFSLKRMEDIHREEAGEPDRPHRHAYYTVLWVREGQGVHQIDFRDYPVEAGALFFVSPGQVHQVQMQGEPQGDAILFTPEFLANNGIRSEFIANLHLFTECGESPPLMIAPEDRAVLEQNLQLLWQANAGEKRFQYEALGAALKLFLIGCARKADTDQGRSAQELHGQQQLISGFKQLVEDRFRSWHKVREYAEALHVTPNYLNDVLRENMGSSAKEYIQSRIILEAKREALFAEASSKEIGYALGFADPAHFSKFFKKCTGSSFSAFRKTIREKYN